ncbi:SAM-dependent methyltransferase [Falsiroseomonas tokyonensis]|uniref:SAM-dependent methyltransferase n=1 Tax=Falsiroseomonas tokyonensis TaxID=430521 RepID=A0ABV7BRC7_9PROT|nr:TrmO family methyltransferase [Falsiroseomonas tokyonensis]MBU8537101.1 SAM-dependent methyltransferase [Falsiroseomonas tokyonensis]
MKLVPIGTVQGGRAEPIDDGWDGVESEIRLDPAVLGPDAALGLDQFSHVVVVFGFHRLDAAVVEHNARHPRGRQDWPRMGILAQRGAPRPNRLGVTTCALLGVRGMVLRLRGLDAIAGSPVFDIKPHMTGFDPRGAIREPDWAREIMAGYW